MGREAHQDLGLSEGHVLRAGVGAAPRVCPSAKWQRLIADNRITLFSLHGIRIIDR